MVVPALEGRTPVDQLEEQDPQAPDVELEVVRTVLDHLWGHVVEGPAEGVAGSRGAVVFGGPAEVAELNVSLTIEE